MRLVHSDGGHELVFTGHLCNRRGDRRLIVEIGQFLLPGAIHVQMLGHISDQIPQALASMVAGAAIMHIAKVMHIAKGALDRVGTRTIGRQQEQGNAWVSGHPVRDSLGLMDLEGIRHDIEPLELHSRIGVVEDLQEVEEQATDFARPQMVAQGAGSQIDCPSQIVLLMRPWRHDSRLRAFIQV
jgi:hypothetical protein